ncbi:MAG: DUF354 domain-containing protein [Candidatus Atabeyarchaeum deiterrae]
MMTFWLDIMTPKQVLLFESIKRDLEAKGNRVIVTTRVHDVVIDLLKLKRIPHFVAGEYGGETLEGKLRASTKRVLSLTDFISPSCKEIDFSMHFSSPEAARVAFGLGLTSICLNDTPHSIAVCKLSFPLSTYVVTPKCISPSKLLKLGASKESIVQYDGVDEVAWIPNVKPDSSVLKALGLDEQKPIVVIRPEESKAAYMRGLKDVNALELKGTPLIEKILKEFPSTQIVVLPRYEEQRRATLERFAGQVIVPDKAIDGPSLIAFSTLTVSGGGTMSWEAALLGVPSICHFPKAMDVERYLSKKGFPIYCSADMGKVTSHALAILRNPSKFRVNTKRLLTKMESPMDAIDRILEKCSR